MHGRWNFCAQGRSALFTRLAMALFVVELGMAGCRSSVQPRAGPATKAAPALRVDLPAEAAKTIVRLGESVNGAPIEMRVFNPADADATPVLILGGIHGDERASVDLTTNLIALLETQPELAHGRKVAIVRVASPDGYARNTRTNARHVDLNRNFKASNFEPSPVNGPAPESEPETRALVKAIDEVHPCLLISIHSIRRGRECNNYDGPAAQIADIMSRHNGYPSVATIGYPTPGSLGSFAGIDRQIPMITLELPRDAGAKAAWQQNREALLAAITAALPAQSLQ
jgi:predicted deacylase